MKHLKHLIIDEKTGTISTTKIWMHVAYCVLTYLMCKQTTLTWELMATYGGIVGGSYSASQFMKWKYKNNHHQIEEGEGYDMDDYPK